MELIIIIFIKPMGAAISGHWDLGDTGTSRDYDALVRSLGWQCEGTAHTMPSAVSVAHALNASSTARFSSKAYCTTTSHSRQSDIPGCQYGCAQ